MDHWMHRKVEDIIMEDFWHTTTTEQKKPNLIPNLMISFYFEFVKTIAERDFVNSFLESGFQEIPKSFLKLQWFLFKCTKKTFTTGNLICSGINFTQELLVTIPPLLMSGFSWYQEKLPKFSHQDTLFAFLHIQIGWSPYWVFTDPIHFIFLSLEISPTHLTYPRPTNLSCRKTVYQIIWRIFEPPFYVLRYPF